MKTIALSLMVLMMSTTGTLAKEIAICGASDGYAFFPKIGLMANHPDAGKWVKDGISKGMITLTQTDDNKYNILIADARRTIISYREDGVVVMSLGMGKNYISITAVSALMTETYTFFRNSKGDAQVMWTSNKWASLVLKAAAYRADCSYFILK